MSDHHAAPRPFYERFWQIGVIAFAIGFVALLVSYAPTSVGGENAATSASQQAEK